MATNQLDSRRMSYAITKLYKHAFATYRHNIFEVTRIESGKPIILSWDVYERMKLRLRLLDPDTFSGLNLPTFEKPSDGKFDSDYMRSFIEKMNIRGLEYIQCKLTDDLQIFMCGRCLRLVKGVNQLYGEGVKYFKFMCPECRYYVTQAPILVYNKRETVGRHLPPMIRPIKANKKECPRCKNNDWLGLDVTDPEKPMGSLYWICRNCKWKVEPFKSFQFGYRPQEPTENLTKGITVSVADAETLNGIKDVSLLNKDYYKGIYYSDKIKVFQVTWGYKVGQYENIRYKTFPNNEFYGRELTTQGLVFEVNENLFEASKEYLKNLYSEDPEYYKEFLKDISSGDEHMQKYQIKRWVLHTLKHALLVFLPVITGLPTMEFSGSYDLEKNRVIIYDDQEGGIGGCKKFWEDTSYINDLVYFMKLRIEECECKSKCPKCLVLNNCGEINQALNRHLLKPLFENIETFYE